MGQARPGPRRDPDAGMAAAGRSPVPVGSWSRLSHGLGRDAVSRWLSSGSEGGGRPRCRQVKDVTAQRLPAPQLFTRSGEPPPASPAPRPVPVTRLLFAPPARRSLVPDGSARPSRLRCPPRGSSRPQAPCIQPSRTRPRHPGPACSTRQSLGTLRPRGARQVGAEVHAGGSGHGSKPRSDVEGTEAADLFEFVYSVLSS